ncbi:two-component regulator propeller domain-containing protein, partial [Calditrichota bacterium]
MNKSGKIYPMAMIYKKLFTFLFLPVFLFPQNQDKSTKFQIRQTEHNIKFERLSTEDGLASSRVAGILQDSQGFMWYATDDGLHKYDGYKFTVYRPETDDPHSISSVFCLSLYEDVNGYIWIGTYGAGLNKFDSHTGHFTRYFYNPDDSLSLSNNYITSISAIPADSGKIIWLGTYSGLSKLNLITNTVERFYLSSRNKDEDSKWANTYTDRSGTLWIAADSGLYKYDREIEKFDLFLKESPIKTMYEDNYGTLWIGKVLNGGLISFNKNSKKYNFYQCDPNNPLTLSSGFVSAIGEDEKGNLWIGTYNGLNLMNREKGTFTRFYNSENDLTSLSHNFIMAIYKSKNGPLWVSTRNGGLTKISYSLNKFSHFQLSTNYDNISGYQSVWPIYKDSTNNKNIVWLGTWGGGLYAYDLKNNTMEQFYYKDYIGANLIKSIYQDQVDKNKLWIGTFGTGIHLFDKNEKVFPNRLSRSAPRIIYSIAQDQSGNILVGSGRELFIFEPQLRKPIHVQDSESQKEIDMITALAEEKTGSVWLGTYGNGLKKLVYNIDTGGKIDKQFSYYHHIEGDSTSLSNNTIMCLYMDSRKNLWIGTKGGGLNKYNPQQDNFLHFIDDDGLPSNTILGILEDDSSNLWMCTLNGIAKYNPLTKTCRNYDVKDGLQGNEFNARAAYKDERGYMYFGGVNGFNMFHPDSISDNKHVPPIVITDFQIFNKSIEPGKDSPIQKNISLVNSITLTHDQDVFSFEFSALDFCSPDKNKYAYKMEGVDPYWVYTDAGRRFATYTKLSPGEYLFRVKGSNNDGIWNEQGTSIKIIITPPWWKTSWAYLLYLLIVVAVVYTLRQYDLRRQRLKNQLELEQMHSEKLTEVDRMKSRFFANISHEFRTPLTLILGPIEKWILKNLDHGLKQDLDIVKRNANRLLRLINQLLDLSTLEAGRMKLQAHKMDIVQFLRELTMSFDSLAEPRKIGLKFKSKIKSIDVFIDKEKFEKIILNLLSNAFKFTPDGGVVEVEISMNSNILQPPLSPFSKGEVKTSPLLRGDSGGYLNINEEHIKITISNTGPGIPADKIDKIFGRFYQLDDSFTREQEGTGIGLALTKELVELHHGKIAVESGKTENQGTIKHPPVSPLNRGESAPATLKKGDLNTTTFTIFVPLGKEHLKEDEIIDISVKEMHSPLAKRAKGLSQIPDEIIQIDDNQQTSKKQAPLILIVEDNIDMRRYISNSLIETYQIAEAEDGEKGFQLAVENIPDLIISDLMMPKMDGFALCRKIKEDQRTSHIPLILLTARAAKEDKMEGWETGADDYIVKPFDAELLSQRVKNLLEQRRKLRERFSREATFQIKEIANTPTDEVFLQKLNQTIEAHLRDETFTGEYLAQEIGMSRMQLYRKLKALTNQSL